MEQTSDLVSKKSLWVARALYAVSVLFLAVDAVTHLAFMGVPQVADSFAMLGLPLHLGVTLGVLELICLVLYVNPGTAVLGAIVQTGYLGGAIAVNLRVGAPVFSLVFPVILGAMFWGALYLRDPRLRALIPFRSR